METHGQIYVRVFFNIINFVSLPWKVKYLHQCKRVKYIYL